MSDTTPLPFRISTGLKNIIGRDLITDDYVAVFELVKNSFDAYAQKVFITFESDKIIIKDDGKGMDIEDIKDKWLFVAYSAKKIGVEDKELEEENFELYRNKIQIKKYYAGAKGIGRFSCDRLGSELILTTRSASISSKLEQIEVNWDDFDVDSRQDFMQINVKHRTIKPFTKEQKQLKHGTTLEISKLNSTWTREKKLDLKKSLEKLINPLDKSEGENQNDNFKIIIEDEYEKENDKKEENERDKINGEVKNFVFETLKLKTTQVLTEIDEKGESIMIQLKDRGTLIYKIKKANNTYPRLKNIKFNLFFLNTVAKVNFTRLMGMQPVKFGSVFVYKNGFRIAPYGDYRDDSFGLDTRHGQRNSRFGTREIIGRIEIIGENPHFREVSSRNAGLVKNEHYESMFNCFIENCLEKLESYIGKVSRKEVDDRNKTDISALNNINSKSAVIEVISDELIGKDIQLEELDKNFANINPLEFKQLANEDVITNLKFIANKLNDKEYSKSVEKAEKENEKLREKLEKEEEERTRVQDENRRLEEELEAEKRENLFNKSLVKTEIKEVVSLQHHIDRATDKINRSINDLIEGINNDSPKQHLLKSVEKISLESKKISTVAQFVTNANFNVKAATITKDLIRFIKNYIENAHQEYEHLKLNRQLLNVEVKADKEPFIISFKPIEIIMIVDNLFSNSDKAEAKDVFVQLKNINNDTFEMIFEDDGKGIPDSNLSRIFNLGFTTTDGSGIGLYHVSTLVKKMKGEIVVNNKLPKGVQFKMTFKRNAPQI